jgi:hypothetical protein
MNIHELDSYDLGDAVKFNDRLNPRIWGADEKMRPEVREQLLRIADDFREFLGIDVEIKDITVSGSNAAYTYTPHSDIDLHLVVDLPKADASEVYRELFDAKKYAYNDMHDIQIGGYDVELYVQDANKQHHSQGIYSIMNDDWVAVPRRRRPDVDDISVKSKFEDLGHRIETAIKSQDYEKISAMAEKIRDYRQAGLDAHGEFGAENLAFKILRTQGLIKQLYDARAAAKDELLSLDERRKKKKKKSVRYGYGGYWYPGTAYAGQDHPAGTEGGDGGGDGGGESIRESVETADEDILRDFIRFCVKELKIEQMPRVRLRRDPQWSAVHKTFGRYNDDANTLEVSWGQRHIMDVLRTVAHELTHKHQHEREGEQMGADAGETGSPYENEANARAGVLMRDYGRLHPEYFSVGQVQDLEESASGYIPTRAQAKDPRFSMALTVDVKPGQVGKEANKLKLKTNRQGQPQIARADGLFEELMLEFQLAKEGIDAPISKTKDEEQYYKFIVAKAKMGRPLTRGEQDFVKMYQMYRQQKLAEFAPTPDRDDNDDVPDQLVVLANRWWNATDRQPQIEHVLNSLGWSIHQVESEDDAVQLQHRNGTTYFISADDFDPDLFESREQQYLWHGSTNKIPVLTPRQAQDTGGATGSNQNAIYATADKNTAIKMGMAERGSDTAILDQADQLVLFSGRLRRGKNVYLHQLPRYDANGQDMWSPGGNGNEFYTKPEVKEIQPLRVITVPVDGHLDLVRKPTAKDLKLRQKYLHQARLKQRGITESADEAVAEGAADHVRMVMNRAADIMKQRGFRAVGQLSDQDLEQIARETDATRHDVDIILNIDHAHELAESTEVLDEVKMSPSALQQWAKSPAAQGIRAGFEAELIFRDTTNGGDDDGEMEPDYDADERARSVSQVIDFFNGGDYGGLSDRQEGRLQDGLDEQYFEWQDERMRDAFDEEAEDLIRKVLVDEGDWDEDNEIQKQLALLDLTDDEINDIVNAGERAPKFTSSKDQIAYAEANPLYQKYLDAQSAAEDLLDSLVEDSVRSQDKFYDAALDDFRENFYVDDDSSFFQDVGLSYMSDIASEYSLDWPYLTGGGYNGGSRDPEEIANDLTQLLGTKVKFSGNWHSGGSGADRDYRYWYVEGDGSLKPDDSDDAGLEIVSPPLPLGQALEKLQQVTDWANSDAGNAYTNSSTGLHMGVSVPFKGGDVDYLKLILFLGDEYVLQSFGREASIYTESAMKKFRKNIKGGRADPAGAMALMKSNLIEFAYREIQKGVGTEKFTSAHIQDGYIEFRSAGGDWLAEGDAEPGKLENTMLRYARAMQIAADPSAERREFAKKLYKLVSPEGDSQLALFSQFAAGEIDKEQLKKQWAEKTIGTERKTNQRWKLYDRATGEPVAGQEYNGYTEEEARAKAKGKISPGSSDRDFDSAYELRNMSTNQQWEVYSVNTGETLEIVTGRNKNEAADAVFDKYANQGIGFNVRPYEDPATMTPRAKLAKRITGQPRKPVDYNYEIVNQADVRLPVVDKFYATNDTDAQKVYSQWLKSKDLPDDTATYGYRKVTAKPAEEPPWVAQNFDSARDSATLQTNLQGRAGQDATEVRRNWEFVDRITGRVVSNTTNASYNQANAVQADIERRYPNADIYLRSVERAN